MMMVVIDVFCLRGCGGGRSLTTAPLGPSDCPSPHPTTPAPALNRTLGRDPGNQDRKPGLCLRRAPPVLVLAGAQRPLAGAVGPGAGGVTRHSLASHFLDRTGPPPAPCAPGKGGFTAFGHTHRRRLRGRGRGRWSELERVPSLQTPGRAGQGRGDPQGTHNEPRREWKKPGKGGAPAPAMRGGTPGAPRGRWRCASARWAGARG